jgi:hypothetical protein
VCVAVPRHVTAVAVAGAWYRAQQRGRMESDRSREEERDTRRASIVRSCAAATTDRLFYLKLV